MDSKVYVVTDTRNDAVYTVIADGEVHARKAVAVTVDGKVNFFTAQTIEGTIASALDEALGFLTEVPC